YLPASFAQFVRTDSDAGGAGCAWLHSGGSHAFIFGFGDARAAAELGRHAGVGGWRPAPRNVLVEPGAWRGDLPDEAGVLSACGRVERMGRSSLTKYRYGATALVASGRPPHRNKCQCGEKFNA